MRILSPKISFKNNLIHDEFGIIKYRNKLELYEKYKTDDLKIWVSNNLSDKSFTVEEQKNKVVEYYNFISLLDNSFSYYKENEEFNKLLNQLRFQSNEDFKSVLLIIKDIILDYELFFDNLKDSYKQELMNTNLNIFIGFSIIIDNYSEEISENFAWKIRVILSDGYLGEDYKNELTLQMANDFTHITEIKSKFIIISYRGPLTFENLISEYHRGRGSRKENTFIDVYNKTSEQQMLGRIYSPNAKIDLKDSRAFVEYIEVEFNEL